MHNTEYSSIFIPKQITVVVKDNQKAYIADSSNPKTLATAEMWANNGMFCIKDEVKSAEKLEYINDGFKLRILSAAGNSSQSGKLSFWTCEVTAPDNRTFKVGVNSELMCELICSSCFINGKCQEDLKFGTRNNQWGFFSESMPSYQSFIESQSLRDSMTNEQTTKYKPGDLVRTLTESKVYLGEVYKYFDYEGNIYHRDLSGLKIIIYKKPIKMHAFAEKINDKWYIWNSSILKKKPKRLIVESGYDYVTMFNNHLEDMKQEAWKYITSDSYSFSITCCTEYLRYGRDPELPDDIRENIFNNLKRKIDTLNNNPDLRYSKFYGNINIEEV